MSDSKKTYGRLVIVAIFLCTMVNYLDRVNISVTAPMMSKEYGWDTTRLGIVFSSFFWGYFLLQLPGGWLADRYGGRRILFGSSLLWAVFTFLTAFPSNLLGLSAVRAGLGAAEAPNFPALTPFIARHLPKHLVSRILGFNFSAIALGPFVGTPFAAFCVIHWGWRSVFYTFAGMSLIWAVLWIWVTNRAGMTDATGAEAEPDAAAGTGQAIFEKPFSKLEVWGSSVAWYCTSYVFYFFVLWLPTYFMKVRGMSAAEMAGFATVPWLVLFITMNVAGYFVDIVKQRSKHSIFWRRMIFAGGFAWSAVFLFPLQHATTSTEAVALICIAFLGLGWTWPVAFALPIEYAPAKAGVVTGFMNSWGQIAGISAPIITGAVIAGGTWGMAFFITAAVSLLGTVLVAGTSHYSTGAPPSDAVRPLHGAATVGSKHA